MEDIRDVKGLLEFPSKMQYLFIVLGIIGISGAIYFLVIFFIRQKARYEMLTAKKPHEIAYERLSLLIKKDYIEKGLIKEFYFELSNIIRHYIEARFGLNAPEMTTEEFLLQVKDSKELDYGYKNLLKDFLLLCDMVKFAKYLPAKKEISGAIDSVKKFIEETKDKKDAETEEVIFDKRDL